MRMSIMTNFSKIKIGATFKAGGEVYRKTSELIFEDVNGLEQYWDPLFDRRIDQEAVPAKAIDTSAKVVKESAITLEEAVKPIKKDE